VEYRGSLPEIEMSITPNLDRIFTKYVEFLDPKPFPLLQVFSFFFGSEEKKSYLRNLLEELAERNHSFFTYTPYSDYTQHQQVAASEV
jgi:hypothetical protein